MIEAVQRDPFSARDPVERLRNEIDEEYLAEFDAIVDKIGGACDSALADIAAQRDLARSDNVNKKRTVSVLLGKGTAAWRDGTAISPAFKACWYAPMVPWEDTGCRTDLPTAPGAWRCLTGANRKVLLGYVLPLLTV